MADSRDAIKNFLRSTDTKTLNLLHKYNLLQPFIEHQLIENITKSFSIPTNLMEKMLANHCEKEGLQSETALNCWLKERCLSRDDLLYRLIQPLKFSKLANDQFGAQAESHFLNRKEELDQVTYSLLRVKNSGMAYELYLQLEANEASFENLAADHSEGPEQRSGGKVGPGSLKQSHPRLQQLLRTATPGVVQEPILIEQWWVVARLDERQETSFNDAMRQRMANELLQDWLTRETKAVVKSLLSAEDGISMP